MPAKKKSAKITTAPSGKSFMYEPRETNREVPCPDRTCDGVVVQESGGFPTCNEGSVFTCTECDWISPSGKFQHEPTQPTLHRVETTVVKTQKQKPRKRSEVETFRAEFRKRLSRLVKEREKIAKLTPKLSTVDRASLRKVSFTSEMIVNDLKGN